MTRLVARASRAVPVERDERECSMIDTQSPASDVIVAERLTKHYSGRCVVNQLNLAIPAGTVYGFLGRNGAGKSTTIRMLLGMTHPTYGRAALLGHDVSRLPPEVRGRIAYLRKDIPFTAG